MKYLIEILKISFIVYVLLVVIFFFFQRKFIYFPQKVSCNITEKDVNINNRDIILRGWVINEGKDNAIIYFGGNAERIDFNIPLFKPLFNNYTVYLMNYRGYGESEGIPTENNLFNDSLVIYDTLKSKYKSISVVGRSLGSGIAAYLASMRDIEKLILVTPFDSIENVIREKLWVLPLSLLVKDKYKSSEYAADIYAKTLIIIAEDDEIISRKRTDALISKLNSINLTVQIINGAGHNNISDYNKFYRCISEFIGSK